MSTSVFPSLIGLSFEVHRAPLWATTIQENISGKEVRVRNQIYPRRNYELTYDVLRGNPSFGEWQTLESFFNNRAGAFDSFLFDDPDDDSITGQTLGTGDGTTTDFPLIRALNLGYVEPVLAPHTVSHVYLNGVDQPTGWTVSTWGSTTPGVLTFTSAPGAAVVVSADFTYYWPVRFVDDTLDFTKFAYQLWAGKSVKMITVK